MQPKPGRGPVALHRCRGKAEHLGRLLDGKAAKKTQLYNLALLWIQFGEFGEGVIKRDQIQIYAFEGDGGVQSKFEAAIAFCGTVAPRIFDQYLPHQLRADGYKMRAILERNRSLFL